MPCTRRYHLQPPRVQASVPFEAGGPGQPSSAQPGAFPEQPRPSRRKRKWPSSWPMARRCPDIAGSMPRTSRIRCEMRSSTSRSPVCCGVAAPGAPMFARDGPLALGAFLEPGVRQSGDYASAGHGRRADGVDQLQGLAAGFRNRAGNARHEEAARLQSGLARQVKGAGRLGHGEARARGLQGARAARRHCAAAQAAADPAPPAGKARVHAVHTRLGHVFSPKAQVGGSGNAAPPCARRSSDAHCVVGAPGERQTPEAPWSCNPCGGVVCKECSPSMRAA